MGFSFRKRDSQKNVRGEPIMQKWVCEKEGKIKAVNNDQIPEQRKRIKPKTRQDCPACFHIKLDQRTQKWW